MSALSSLSDLDYSDDEYQPRRARVLRDLTNPLQMFNDAEFKIRFRFSKQSVTHIVEQIGPQLEPRTQRNRSISAQNQVLLTLRFYATGAFQQLVGDSIGGLHKSAVCRIIKRVTHHIASLKPAFIRTPRTQEERNHLKVDFFNLRGFPGVFGAVDCTHIRLQSPGGPNAELFRNRKGFFSINVQAVCDSELKIWNIIARWPGSVHDSTIFNDSALCAELENGNFGSDYILGDKGYPCKRYLLTPFNNPATPGELAYNVAHAATRNPIERCFGVLKRRFPVLAVGLRLQMNTSLAVIVACAVLHNLAIELNGDLPDVEIGLIPAEFFEELPALENQNNANIAVRRSIVTTVFD